MDEISEWYQSKYEEAAFWAQCLKALNNETMTDKARKNIERILNNLLEQSRNVGD